MSNYVPHPHTWALFSVPGIILFGGAIREIFISGQNESGQGLDFLFTVVTCPSGNEREGEREEDG